MTIKRIGCGPRMSQAVIHGDIIYLSGQIAEPKADITTQTHAVLAQIDNLLGQAGSHKSRILNATIWLADMSDFAAMNTVWEKWIDPENPPARATGEVKLATDDYKIEIMITAAKGAC